jgi:hypothetical protein
MATIRAIRRPIRDGVERMNEVIRCIERFLTRQSNNCLQGHGAKGKMVICGLTVESAAKIAIVTPSWAVLTAALLPWGSWARRKSSLQALGL